MKDNAGLVSDVQVSMSEADLPLVLRPPAGLVRHVAHLSQRPSIRLGHWFTINLGDRPVAMARVCRVARCECCAEGWELHWQPATTTLVC